LHGSSRIGGIAVAVRGSEGHALLAAERAHHGAPAVRRLPGSSDRYPAARQEIQNIKRRLNEIYVKHTGQNYQTIEDSLERDRFMTAEQAKEFGLIDKVIEKRPDDSATSKAA